MKILGLIVFLMTSGVHAKSTESLFLRAYVPEKVSVEIHHSPHGPRPVLRTNSASSYRNPRLNFQRVHDTYIVAVIQP